MSAVQKMVQYLKWRHVMRSCCQYMNLRRNATAAVVIAHCALKEDKRNPIKFPDSSSLSHEQLIQQACTATVNSTCQLLTCTLVAMVEIGQKYSKALSDQMSLLEECLSNIGNDAIQEDLTDLITEARSSVDTFRRNFRELDSLMEYVEKLVNSATETSYLAGAETACIALSERLHSAKTKIEEQKQLIKNLEKELVLLQQEVIRKTGNPENKR